MIAFNTKVFDNLGSLDHLNEASHVVKLKELFADLQAVASQSALRFNAAAAIIGCTNQLSSVQKGNTGVIRMSAIEKQRGRRSKHVHLIIDHLYPTPTRSKNKINVPQRLKKTQVLPVCL